MDNSNMVIGTLTVAERAVKLGSVRMGLGGLGWGPAQFKWPVTNLTLDNEGIWLAVCKFLLAIVFPKFLILLSPPPQSVALCDGVVVLFVFVRPSVCYMKHILLMAAAFIMSAIQDIFSWTLLC